VKPIDLKVEGTRQGAIEIARNRMIMLMALFVIGFFSLAVKLISLGVFQAQPSIGYVKSNVVNSAIMARADIVDRNGVVLATNLKTPSLGAHPYKILNAQALAPKIAKILPSLTEGEILANLQSERRHIWIKRKLTPKQMYEINKLGEPGLVFSDAEKRIYPQGSLLSHVLGSVSVDNNPSAGVELFFNDHLSDPMRSDEPLMLSIDVRLQHILNHELHNYIEKFSSKGAAGLILDVQTGEILALSSLPDFDPNESVAGNDPRRFNQILQGVYELGSGFKTFTVASALENKVVDLSGGYDASKPVKVSRFTIHDDHAKNRWLNVPEIFVYSSNIGVLKMAQDLGIERQKALFEKLGLFRKSDVEILELAHPILPSQWGVTELVTTSYGHGIAVTPLHLASGMAAMVNGGRLIPATLLKKTQKEKTMNVSGSSSADDNRVISPRTSEIMRNLLRLVVEYGTGRSAKVDGYLIGGKTGTAWKAAEKNDGFKGYNKNRVLSSFVSVFPADNPKYVIFAMLDEPHGITETFNMVSGGWTAAPLVGNVIKRIGPLLGIVPTNENEIEFKELMLVSGEHK
jgi:cell division protein FtsI (penicillin-binding protein 3)